MPKATNTTTLPKSIMHFPQWMLIGIQTRFLWHGKFYFPRLIKDQQFSPKTFAAKIATDQGYVDICLDPKDPHPKIIAALNRYHDLATGEMFLHIAAKHGRATTITKLLEAGADPALTDRDNRTPLMIAIAIDSIDAVRALLNSGKDVGICKINAQGLSALFIACFASDVIFDEIVAYIKHHNLAIISNQDIARFQHLHIKSSRLEILNAWTRTPIADTVLHNISKSLSSTYAKLSSIFMPKSLMQKSMPSSEPGNEGHGICEKAVLAANVIVANTAQSKNQVFEDSYPKVENNALKLIFNQ